MITRIGNSNPNDSTQEGGDLQLKYEVIRSLIEDSKQPVILDFSATWCGPCKKLYPLLKALAEKYTNIHFFKIDIGQNDQENLGDLYNISSLPTCLFFCQGQLLKKEEGLQPGASNITGALSLLVSQLTQQDQLVVQSEINNYLAETSQSKTR